MGKQLRRHAELMGDNIIGIYLSGQPLCESNQTIEDDEPKLRRFVHDQEMVEQPRLIKSSDDGVFIWAIIKGAEYLLKVVSL